MKKLLITLLLISPFSFADWGDVYYCQETSYVTTDRNGKLQMGELNRFQFKLDETKNAMVFGSGSTLSDKVLQLREGGKLSGEWWIAEDVSYRIHFKNGKLLFTMTEDLRALIVSADCDKF